MFDLRVKRTTRHLRHRMHAESVPSRRRPVLLPVAYGGCLRPEDDVARHSREAEGMETEKSGSTGVMAADTMRTRAPVPAVWWSGARPAERLAHAVGLVLILSGLVHLAVFAVDGGPWYGPVSWRKPVTFGLSFGATLIAVTWVTSY